MGADSLIFFFISFRILVALRQKTRFFSMSVQCLYLFKPPAQDQDQHDSFWTHLAVFLKIYLLREENFRLVFLIELLLRSQSKFAFENCIVEKIILLIFSDRPTLIFFPLARYPTLQLGVA